MQIQSLRLRNFCQHRDRLFQFSPGLNVIIGPNGSGKSNIMNAMLLALTGINRNYGPMDRNISQYAEPGEPAFVELIASHAGHSIRVKRDLTGGVELQLDDEKPSRGAKAAAAKLLSLMRVGIDQVKDHVFVQQKQIDSWLTMDPADKSAALIKRFGLERATAAKKVLENFTAKIALPTTTMTVEQLQVAFQHHLQQLQRAEQDLLGLLPVPEDLAKFEREQSELISKWENHASARMLMEAEQVELQRTREALAPLTQSLQQLQSELAMYRDALPELQAQANAATHELKAWDAYNSSLRDQTLYEDARATAMATFRRRLPRPRPVTPLTAEEQAQLLRLSQELNQEQNSWTQLTRVPLDAACPVCGEQPVTRSHRVQALQATIAPLQAAVQPLAAKQALFDDYSAKLTASLSSRQAVKDRLATVRLRKEALGEVSRPTTTVDELRQRQANLAKVESAIGVARTLYEQQTQQQLLLLQREQSIEAKLANMAVFAACEVTAEQANAAKQLLAQTRQAFLDRQAILQRKRSAELAMSDLQARIDDVQAVLAKAAKISQAVAKLRAGADILHHEQAPRTFTFTRLIAMTDEINRSLGRFNADYTVTTDESLSFTAQFFDGRRVDDRRLSVGQGILLSLSLCVAMNTTFAAEIGLLALDEPTAFLDSANLRCVPAAVANLKELANSTGLQVFLVTHEERLIDTYDRLIDLGQS